MGRIWFDDPNYSHGFLIPIISLYILWQRRNILKTIETTSAQIGYLPLVMGISLYAVGTIGDESFTRGLSFIFVISGLVLVLYGKEIFIRASFSIAYLVFMIPLPYYIYNELTVPLKLIAAKISTEILHFFSYPIFRDGNILQLPNITLEVADACSGIRSILSITALAVAMAWIFHKVFWKRICLSVLSIPIALSVNVIRVVVTGILSYHFGEKMAKGFFHDFSGLVIFSLALIMVFGSNILLLRLKK